MNKVTISYKKCFGREGVVYSTRVNMPKDIFEEFLIKMNNEIEEIKEYSSKNFSVSYDMFHKKTYIERDIEDYSNSSNKNIMYIGTSSAMILNEFLSKNNLNPLNRIFSGNTYITIK